MSVVSPPSLSIYELFYQQSIKTPLKIAVASGERHLSYYDLNQQIERLSDAYIANGIKTNDTIGVILPNDIEQVIIMLVAAKLGLSIVPHNLNLPPKDLVLAFTTTHVKHIVVWHAIVEEIRPQLEKFLVGIWFSVGADQKDCLNIDKILSNDTKKTNGDDYKTVKDSVTASNLDINQPYILTMTSGATGAPKPIVLSQKTKILRAQAAINLYHVCGEDIILVATPLYHSLAQRLLIMSLISGASCVILPGFTPHLWLAAVEQYKVSFSIAVSSQLRQVVVALSQSSYNMDSLRCLVSSSELLPVDLKEVLIRKLQCEFHECYGASEVAIVSNLSARDDANAVASVGKPIADVDIKIINEEQQLVAENEIGEIICKTPMLFSGYYRQVNTTSQAMWQDYFKTGDLGYLDNNNYLYFCGRKKDIVITGGINIYPKDIEDKLRECSGVQDAVVIPVPDRTLGESIAAVIVIDKFTSSVGTDLKSHMKQKLERHCVKELADFQQPRHYAFIESMPRNQLGKIDKIKLKEEWSVIAYD